MSQQRDIEIENILQNAPKCPTCGSDDKNVKLCVSPDTKFKHIPGTEGNCKECPDDWHREQSVTCPSCGSDNPKCPTCGSRKRDVRNRVKYEGRLATFVCYDDWHREPAAPPAGMTAAEFYWQVWEGIDCSQELLDKMCEFAEAYAAHLRGEVERLTRESIQYDELRKQQIWQLEAELERLREHVRQITETAKDYQQMRDAAVNWRVGLEAIERKARAALESTTPQEKSDV